MRITASKQVSKTIAQNEDRSCSTPVLLLVCTRHLEKQTLWMFESFGGFIAARALGDRI